MVKNIVKNILIKAGTCKFNSEIVETFFQKTKGLMFSEKKNVLFIFECECIFGIHSFFVFFPFDAIYIDEKKKVVDVVRKIKPFTVCIRNKKPAKYLLELTNENNLKIGDLLEW